MGKKRIYIKVLVVVATVFVIGGIIAKTVDKRRQTYYERISEMLGLIPGAPLDAYSQAMLNSSSISDF